MKKKLTKAMFLLSVIVVYLCNNLMLTLANEDQQIEDIKEFLVFLDEEFEEFENSSLNANKFKIYDGELNDNIYSLYSINIDGKEGYIIWNMQGNYVAEVSKNNNPYILAETYNNIDNGIWIYQNGNYAILKSETVYEFDASGEIYCINDNISSNVISRTTINSGYSPQLQNSHNCIVAAVANVINYYGEYKYPTLIGSLSFTEIKNRIDSYFTEYSNNNVHKAVYSYVKSRSYSFNSICEALWSPSKEDLKYEINEGRPCLVGFKAGVGSYSEVVGHMTACFGYQEIPGGGGSILLKLADGHSANYVYKTWSSLNDCIITMEIYK